MQSSWLTQCNCKTFVQVKQIQIQITKNPTYTINNSTYTMLRGGDDPVVNLKQRIPNGKGSYRIPETMCA